VRRPGPVRAPGGTLQEPAVRHAADAERGA